MIQVLSYAVPYIFLLVVFCTLLDYGRKPYFEMPRFALVQIAVYLAMLFMAKSAIPLCHFQVSANNANGTEAGMRILFFGMILVNVACIMGFFAEYGPMYVLLKCYANSRKSGPLISYLIFKKMDTLHPDDFVGCDNGTLLYKGNPFSLRLLPYIFALEKTCKLEHKNKRKHKVKVESAAQRKLYDEMLKDLQSDLKDIQKQKKEASAQIELAMDNYSKIIDSISEEK